MVDVGIPGGLLGGHVGGGAEGHAHGGQPALALRLAHGLGHAEVGDERVIAGEEDVVGFDVAMHDAARVRVGERVGDILEDAHGVAHGQLALAGETRAQRLALDERHRVVEDVAFAARREQRHDVRMLQRRGELDLAVEAVDADLRRQLGRQDFDDDLAGEPGFFGEEHAAHAAAAQLPLDAIRRPEGGLQAVGELGHGTKV